MANQRELLFQVFAPQTGCNFEALLARAETAERLNYHTLWLVDHFWSLRQEHLEQLECLAAMSALAMRTSRLRLGTMVLCNGFRNPALLAKMLSTIDQISRGRLEVALGAGWMAPEFAAYGYEFPPIGTRLKQLDEALQIVRLMFTEPKASFQGQFYKIADAVNHPKPLQKPHPPITIGGRGEKVMMRIVARHADRWNIPAGYDSLERVIGVFKEHCQAVNRDFESVELSEQVMICLGRTAEEVAANWKVAERMRPFNQTAIKGTPSEVAAALSARHRQGVTTFVLFFSDYGAPATLELFAREVIPAVN